VRRTFTILTFIAVVATLAAACGGGGNDGAASGGTPPATAPATTQGGDTTGGGGRGGYGYSGGGGGGGSGGQAAKGSVRIAGFAFNPASHTAKVGDSVTWTNKDGTTHTVTADKGAFDAGGLAPGKSFSFTFDQAGTFANHCKIHPSMTGKVTVSG
jgi:plastocyanin